jgi:hypothetical protein
MLHLEKDDARLGFLPKVVHLAPPKHTQAHAALDTNARRRPALTKGYLSHTHVLPPILMALIAAYSWTA